MIALRVVIVHIGFVETGIDAALTTVQRMRQILSDTMQQQHWPVTFSIGVATFTSPPASVDVLIHAADQLMYAAKQSGKNAVRHAVIGAGMVGTDAAPAEPDHGGQS